MAVNSLFWVPLIEKMIILTRCIPENHVPLVYQLVHFYGRHICKECNPVFTSWF